MSQKYVIVHFIDIAKVPYEFPYTEWPLHVTLLSNFTLGEPIEFLDSKLREFTLHHKPFNLMADGEALFGPKQNIAVTLIKPNNTLQNVHDELASITSGLGAVFDEPAFMGAGFRPHATKQIHSQLADKQILILNNFTLVDMYPNNNIERRKVIKTFELTS